MKTTTNLLNRVGESVGRYRWVICSLLFFATTINYLDRAVIGLLKETLTADLHWTESDYGNIIVCFQLAYALSLLFVGRVIDWVGTKLGYGLSLAVWSMAPYCTVLLPEPQALQLPGLCWVSANRATSRQLIKRWPNGSRRRNGRWPPDFIIRAR